MKLKPLKSYIGINFLYPIIFILIFALCIIGSERNNLKNKDVIVALAVLSAIVLIIILTYVLVMLLYPIRYTVTETEIIMYKKGKPYHSVKVEDIAEIGIRLLPWWSILFAPIALLCSTPEVLNVMSIRYFSEVPAPSRIVFDHWNMETLTDEEKKQGLVEMVDCFTLTEIKKICRIINRVPKEVEYLPKKIFYK